MKIELVQAKESDRKYLFDLRLQTMVAHLERSGQFLSDQEHEVRVDYRYDCSNIVHLEGKVIGMLKYASSDEKVNVMQIQIAPEFQNKGYGRLIMEHVIELAKPKPVSLWVLKENPAYKLYLDLGFIVVGENKFEYHLQTRQ